MILFFIFYVVSSKAQFKKNAEWALYFRKSGICVMIAAALIGFSRLYLFVHFPTDVLFGAVLGIALAFITVKVQQSVMRQLEARRMNQKQ